MLIRPTLLFDGLRLRSGTTVRLENGRIVEITTEDLAPGECALTPHLLSPGFIDIHIHGCAGSDTMQGEDAVRAMARHLPRYGVTGFAPTTMAASIEDTRAALSGVSRAMKRSDGARVLGCHLEGPFLNSARKGAQPEQFLLAPTMDACRAIVSGLEGAALLMTLAPELPGAAALISALRGRIALSAGHSDATCEQICEAAALGVNQVTHLFNAMNPLSHRAPGVAGAALTEPGLSVQLIADLLHLHPSVLRLAWRAKGARGCILISDAMEAAGMPDGEYRLGANRVVVKGGAARLAEGNLAGSTLTMDQAVRNMHREVGVPLDQALRMATRNPARSVGLRGLGRIAPGLHADLALLDEALRVTRTLVGGETVFHVKQSP